jgi:hypothetical protein
MTQALPLEITGSYQSWWSDYRRYPIFSRPWAQGRGRAWALVIAITLLLTAASMASTEEPMQRLWAVVLKLGLLLLPAVVGPWAAHLVWRHTREGLWPDLPRQVAIGAAILTTCIASMLASRYLASPITDRILALTGHDVSAPTAARARAEVQIGIVVGPQGRATTEGARLKRDTTSADDDADDTAPPGILQWSTTAAALFLLGGGLGVWGLRREARLLHALEQQRALARERAQRREAEMRLSVLAAQVEPHFLFNTLAGVRSAIHSDPERASTMVDRLVDYLRTSIPRLRSDGSAEATLGAQLEVVRAYLALIASRIPRLSFTIDARPESLDLPFPPLMLITLAENAVKHGVEPKVGPARITVSAERLPATQQLAVTVADDGAGFGAADTAGSGIGLANIRERLAQMFGNQASLSLKARPGGGVAATITVPLSST